MIVFKVIQRTASTASFSSDKVLKYILEPVLVFRKYLSALNSSKYQSEKFLINFLIYFLILSVEATLKAQTRISLLGI